LRVGKELTEYWKGDLTYRYESIKITNLSDGASADLVRESGTNAISSMELGINFDNRDNVLEPTKGNFIENSFKLAGGPFGASKDFWKYYLRASRYFPLFLGSVLEVRGRMGLAEKYSDTGWVPIYERYFAGGAYTIRGYDERKVGPIDQATKDPLGGDSMLIGNIEYLYPLFSFLKVATFCDMGNVWSKMGDIGSGGIKYGAGFGVRLKTPIGPIALDYGIPFNKEPGEENKKGGKFHFSMSHGF
jgi:outer membrane protein assembly factor BamA